MFELKTKELLKAPSGHFRVVLVDKFDIPGEEPTIIGDFPTIQGAMSVQKPSTEFEEWLIYDERGNLAHDAIGLYKISNPFKKPKPPETSFGPPGPPPRPGLVWHEPTDRWRNPENWEENIEQPSRREQNVDVMPQPQSVQETPKESPAQSVQAPAQPAQPAQPVQAPIQQPIGERLGVQVTQVENLTSKEQKALNFYTEGLSRGINDYLRQGQVNENYGDAERFKQEYVAPLLSAMNKNKLNQDIQVFRGVGNISLDQFQEGSVFTDKGFISTSLNRDTSMLFTNNISFVIDVPKGTSFLPGTDMEEEFILPPNSKFKVGKIDQQGSQTVVHMGLVE